MTHPPYRSPRAQAAAHDRQMAGAYQDGLRDGRRGHRRLIVLGAVGALVLLGRRRVHPLVGLVLVVLVLPLVVLGTVGELVHRQHQRWCSWPRTGALVATWAAVAGMVYLAARYGTPWPLVALPVALAAWMADHVRRARDEAGMMAPPEAGRDAGRAVALAPPFRVPPPVEPYRVTFTSKAEHRETRTYTDGRSVTIDTRTGQVVEDPFGPF